MLAAQQAAEAAATAAGAAAVQNMPEELDEFGRDMNVEKRRQVKKPGSIRFLLLPLDRTARLV